MEHAIRAPRDGVVRSVRVAEGRPGRGRGGAGRARIAAAGLADNGRRGTLGRALASAVPICPTASPSTRSGRATDCRTRKRRSRSRCEPSSSTACPTRACRRSRSAPSCRRRRSRSSPTRRRSTGASTGSSGVRYPALVPNVQGSSARSRPACARSRCSRRPRRRSTARTSTPASTSRSSGSGRSSPARSEEKIRVRGYVSTAFGCPYEGDIAPEAVREVVHKLLDLAGRRDLHRRHDRRRDAGATSTTSSRRSTSPA